LKEELASGKKQKRGEIEKRRSQEKENREIFGEGGVFFADRRDRQEAGRLAMGKPKDIKKNNKRKGAGRS